jgi:hypothetical protein
LLYRAEELSVRTKFSISRLAGLAVAVTAAVALTVGGAGVASAAATSASTHVVTSRATRSAVTPDTIFVIGPVNSFSTEDQCLLFGDAEFPPGSDFMGYLVIGTFCEEGEALPPRIGTVWNLFVVVETMTCGDLTAAAPVPDARVC